MPRFLPVSLNQLLPCGGRLLQVGLLVALDVVALERDRSIIADLVQSLEKSFLGETTPVQGLDQSAPIIALAVRATGAHGEQVRCGLLKNHLQIVFALVLQEVAEIEHDTEVWVVHLVCQFQCLGHGRNGKSVVGVQGDSDIMRFGLSGGLPDQFGGVRVHLVNGEFDHASGFSQSGIGLWLDGYGCRIGIEAEDIQSLLPIDLDTLLKAAPAIFDLADPIKSEGFQHRGLVFISELRHSILERIELVVQ